LVTRLPDLLLLSPLGFFPLLLLNPPRGRLAPILLTVARVGVTPLATSKDGITILAETPLVADPLITTRATIAPISVATLSTMLVAGPEAATPARGLLTETAATAKEALLRPEVTAATALLAIATTSGDRRTVQVMAVATTVGLAPRATPAPAVTAGLL
jgi:hypothetical protein